MKYEVFQETIGKMQEKFLESEGDVLFTEDKQGQSVHVRIVIKKRYFGNDKNDPIHVLFEASDSFMIDAVNNGCVFSLSVPISNAHSRVFS